MAALEGCKPWWIRASAAIVPVMTALSASDTNKMQMCDIKDR